MREARQFISNKFQAINSSKWELLIEVCGIQTSFSADWREWEERAGLGRRSTRGLALVSGLQRVKWDPSPGFVVNQARKTPGDISICRDLGRLRECRLSAEQTCKQTTPAFSSSFSCCTRQRHSLLSFDFTVVRETAARHRFPLESPCYPTWSMREPLPFLAQRSHATLCICIIYVCIICTAV